MDQEKKNLDEVLDKFCIFGRYHIQFMIFAIYAYACNSVVATTYIFVGDDKTGYRCVDETFSNDTCGIINGVRCTEWVYDNPHSFVAEFDLACEGWKTTLLGTIHIFGYMIGLCILGPLSDKIGRKNTLILAGVLGPSTGIAKSFSHSYWLYVFLEFLVPIVGNWYSPLYVLNLEIVSAKKRVIYHFICGLGSIIGGLLAPLAAWGIPYWRSYLIIVYMPSFLIVFGLCLIDESPRWLLTRRKKDKAIDVVQKMFNKNNMRNNRENLNNIVVDFEETKSIAFLDLLKLTFQSRALLKRFFVCIVWWMASVFVNYGTLINSVSLQGNKYINYALLHVIEIPGNLIITYILTKFKRRYPLVCTFFAAAILYFIHPFLPKDIAWLSVTIYLTGRMMSSFYFHITYIYTSELFPTYTRNSMHAMCSALGRIGGMIAPQTPLLMVYWSGFPALLFSVSSLVAGLVSFLVPDTADDALPDTVTQAELIGTKQKKSAHVSMTGIDNLGMSKDLSI